MRRKMSSILMMACVVTVACGWVADEVVPLPPTLVGTWTTDDARYEGRFFELTPTTLVIGTGEGRATSYPIAGVHLTRDDRGTAVHRLDYVDGGTVSSMAFYFSPGEADATLRMRNQPTIVWRKSRG